jgi:hypothetical protein
MAFPKKQLFSLITGVMVSQLFAAPDPNFHIFLCFGQSNMAGGAKPGAAIDCDTLAPAAQRVKVLAFTDCSSMSTACANLKIDRTRDTWYTAFPPYNNCGEGIGPMDYFGKTLIDSIRDDIKIGFVPCALSGQSIKVFAKGSLDTISSYTQPAGISRDAYAWMVKRAKIAQESGVIKGMLFHQGETDNGQSWWVNTAKGVFNDLKKDLGLGDIPIILGELLQEKAEADTNQANPCCAAHNTLIHQLASEMPNCSVASSQGLHMRANDKYKAHFDLPGMRELGRRYAKEFLKLASKESVPRKGRISITPQKRQ